MNFDEYQAAALTTAIYPKTSNIIYPALGIVGEAGEVANQVKKIVRDDDGQLTFERKIRIIDELGDVLWYAAALASDIGITLDDIAEQNLAKLKARATYGSISGDKREEG